MITREQIIQCLEDAEYIEYIGDSSGDEIPLTIIDKEQAANYIIDIINYNS